MPDIFAAAYVVTIGLSFMAVLAYAWLCWRLRGMVKGSHILYWLFIAELVNSSARFLHEGWWFSTRVVASVTWDPPHNLIVWFWVASISAKVVLALGILGVVIWALFAWLHYR